MSLPTYVGRGCKEFSETDVNVLWDLAVYDLAIMDYALRQRPVSVSCTGLAHLQRRPETSRT